MTSASIRVEVVYALPERCWSVRLQLPEGSRVAAALDAARPQLPEDIVIDTARLAVFGRTVSPEGVLRDGDRVEILRPLIADPKQARRQRAAGGH
jgi:putative ubiquitin-RnfH superfamily antitoxin RatB of RatAB toxin-antitoxin module